MGGGGSGSGRLQLEPGPLVWVALFDLTQPETQPCRPLVNVSIT